MANNSVSASASGSSDGADDGAVLFPRVELRLINGAFAYRIREFRLVNFGYVDIEEFLLASFEQYQTLVTEAVIQFDMIKTLSYFSAEFERAIITGDNDDEDEGADPLFEKRTIHIPTQSKRIDSSTNISEHFRNDIIANILRQIDEVMIRGSGFTLSKIIHLEVQILKYEPLGGGAEFIELPKVLKNKKAIVNLKNTGDECFKWSILASSHYDEVYARNKFAANNANYYHEWRNELNFDGIDFPVRINQIEQFMRQNNNLAVNVYYWDGESKRLCPLFLAMKPLSYRYIHLLLITEEAVTLEHAVNVKSHYCLITRLDRLAVKQLTKHGHKIHVCNRCLNFFNTVKKLKEHHIVCQLMNDTAIEMPSIDNKYEKFKDFYKEIKNPFIVYADCEALLRPPDAQVFNAECSTKALNQHEVHSIGYYFKHEHNETRSRYAYRRGTDCLDWFTKELTGIATEAYNFLKYKKKPMFPLTESEEKSYMEATVCHICKKKLKTDPSGAIIKVKDHCHMTGKNHFPFIICFFIH